MNTLSSCLYHKIVKKDLFSLVNKVILESFYFQSSSLLLDLSSFVPRTHRAFRVSSFIGSFVYVLRLLPEW